jgi:hypothetical protein
MAGGYSPWFLPPHLPPHCQSYPSPFPTLTPSPHQSLALFSNLERIGNLCKMDRCVNATSFTSAMSSKFCQSLSPCHPTAANLICCVVQIPTANLFWCGIPIYFVRPSEYCCTVQAALVTNIIRTIRARRTMRTKRTICQIKVQLVEMHYPHHPRNSWYWSPVLY